jgi:hypothetical protein
LRVPPGVRPASSHLAIRGAGVSTSAGRTSSAPVPRVDARDVRRPGGQLYLGQFSAAPISTGVGCRGRVLMPIREGSCWGRSTVWFCCCSSATTVGRSFGQGPFHTGPSSAGESSCRSAPGARGFCRPEWRNGRRSGLKIHRGQPRASSNLASGTRLTATT